MEGSTVGWEAMKANQAPIIRPIDPRSTILQENERGMVNEEGNSPETRSNVLSQCWSWGFVRFMLCSVTLRLFGFDKQLHDTHLHVLPFSWLSILS